MNIENKAFIIWAIIIAIVYVILILRTEYVFSKWVLRNWFKKRTFSSYLSISFGIIGFVFLIFSILDFRGNPEKIKSKMSKQKTIILIDTSESMLAEDIRPNRMNKAIIVAKHFVKKAIGHEISVVIFSDNTKKLIPFTTDTDLIESRLDILSNPQLIKGGTSLTLALSEAVKDFSTDNGQVEGNLLLITDAEENESGMDLEIPDKISLAVVGIGSSMGAQIPIRNEYSYSNSVKMYDGKPVETKLDEKFLKYIVSRAKHGKYWVASSYGMPTEEIISYFNQVKKSKKLQGDATVKKILGHHVIGLGLLFLLMSYLLRYLKSFKQAALILIIGLSSSRSLQAEEKKFETFFSKELSKLKDGKLNEIEKQKLYEKMLREGFFDKANTGYQESKERDQLSPEARVNYGTSLIKAGKLREGMNEYREVQKKIDSGEIKNDNLKEIIKKNTILGFSGEEDKKKKDQNKQDQNKQDQNKQDQNKQDQNKQDQNKQDQNKQDQNKQDQNKQDQNKQVQNKQDQNKQDQNKEDKNKQDQKKKDKDGEGDDKDKKEDGKKEKNENNEQKSENENRPKKKLPPILKQLMSRDRELQMKFLDTVTKDRRNGAKKDW